MPSSAQLPPMQDSFLRFFFRNTFSTKLQPPPHGLDLTGQTGIITGGNSGIGLECVSVLLTQKLSRIILAVRSIKKGVAVATELQKTHPAARIDVWSLDLSSYDSIDEFAKRCATLKRLDFAILNAGVSIPRLQINESTGHEENLQVNYLSNVLLLILLLPILKEKSPSGKPGRLTLVSTGLVYVAKLDEQKATPLLPAFNDPQYFSRDRYATSKLLGMMFVSKLKDFVAASDVVVNLVEPGFVKGNTNLDRYQPASLRALGALFRNALGRPLKAGAWTYVDAALVKGKETHGSFLLNWEIYP